MRNGQARNVECPGQMDFQHPIPVVRVDVLHGCGGAGDPGAIDQHVDPAKRGGRLGDHGLDLEPVRDVAQPRPETLQFGRRARQGRRIDVARIDVAAFREKRPGDRLADAGAAGGDEDLAGHDAFSFRDVRPDASIPVLWRLLIRRARGKGVSVTVGTWRSAHRAGLIDLQELRRSPDRSGSHRRPLRQARAIQQLGSRWRSASDRQWITNGRCPSWQ